MKKNKIGRNDPCPCGSKQKYKQCCLNIKKRKDFPSNNPLDKKIIEASKLALEHDEKSIITSIDTLKELLNHKELNSSQKQNILINLTIAYQHRGEHVLALETLNYIANEYPDMNDEKFLILCDELAAISYTSLGLLDDACLLFDKIIDKIKTIDIDIIMRGMIYLEAGKTYKQNKKAKKAKQCWEKALKIFSNEEKEIEHFARTKANLGLLLLDEHDEKKQEEGIKLIEESSELKKLVGDIEGLANNYANLGRYYWKIKRYERAIAFTRKDLYLSRIVGNIRSVASTLSNLSIIYAGMKQLSAARRVLKEAKVIGQKLNDPQLLAIIERTFKHVNKIGKKAGGKKELVGPAAKCACGSQKEFQDCCGKADFEPVDIPMIFGGLAEDVSKISEEIIKAGGKPSRLDFILRETSDIRLAWTEWKIQDGWVEMHELPDMANHHLISAKSLAEEAQSGKDSFLSISKPISCLFLSVCALEAFINQVSYFFNEIQASPDNQHHHVPCELADNVINFQRTTELSQKWDILGNALCKGHWQPPDSLWAQFRNLIYIRNELIHFKVDSYEQVVPRPKETHNIIKRIPSSVETRNIPRGWPLRILTPSFAKWSVMVSESMIKYFRKAYKECRLEDRKTQKTN